jgi:hypothetical protein
VFGCASIEGANVAPSAWSYRIDSWNNYVEYLSSYEAKNIVRRPKYFKYHEWNGVGVDNIKLGDDNGNC